MKINKEPGLIWDEYLKGRSYNTEIGLYDRVKQNENFYNGRQWEGLNAPELEKPVLNFLKRAVNYYNSMLVSDDVGLSVRPFLSGQGSEELGDVMSGEIERVIEMSKAKALHRDMLLNAAVDGDGCFYLRFDMDAETGQTAKGDIVIENIDNTKVLFGNPYVADVQSQPYILLIKRELLSLVKEKAEAAGLADEIRPDETDMYGGESYGNKELVTVITKMWRENGMVHTLETTRDCVLRQAFNTDCRLYPIAYMSWEKVKNSYHGQSPIAGLIPNQIAVNRLLAMAIHNEKTTAFPKIFYDAGKIDSWSNKIGEAIAVNGNPNEAIASSFRAGDMSAQVIQLINHIIDWTKELMGANDAALGNVRPDNTSAIIAVQKASAMPLEIQKLAFFQFVEDYVRIIVDMMSSYYGVRLVRFTGADGDERQKLIDFSRLRQYALSIKVDVGSASYWNEIAQIQTLDNLFAKGIIDDALLYLEQLPRDYVRNKNKIIAKLKARQQALPG